ncbi:MAG TPA: CAP domain-containing protein [Gaiellaceae bacterium]|nr:CAP domain-containing protein [Gaiellaceae bacterium]
MPVALAAVFAAADVWAASSPERGWVEYLAPPSACPGATDASAPVAVQREAIGCLVNWARGRARNRRLAPSRPLERAAVLKGLRVAACGDFAHAPCGTEVTATVRRAGYAYRRYGENLFAGTWGRYAPREVVAAWLRSPSHRATLLAAQYRDVGAALVRARGLVGMPDAAVWVAAFGVRR